MSFFRPSKIQNYADLLLLNKHAPKTLKEFRGNQGVQQTLLSYLDSGNLPHLLITGPHGCGKGLIAKLLVKEYFGPYMSEGCLEIYGSLTRGKDAVTEKQSVKNKQKNFNCPGINHFMKKKTNLPPNLIKIIVIYEFHQMSPEAQNALRRIIELNSNRVRFIFLTEDHTNLMPAIQSRCTPLQMHKLDDDELDLIVKEIMKKEGYPFDQELLELIRLNADGDIRIAINLLQILAHKDLKNDDWYQILGIPEIKYLKKIIKACLEKRSTEAYRLTKQLLNQGFDICDILDSLSRVLIYYPEFSTKKSFLRVLCKDTFTIEECYTETQLYNMLNHFCEIKA